jgi:hypothetical protein
MKKVKWESLGLVYVCLRDLIKCRDSVLDSSHIGPFAITAHRVCRQATACDVVQLHMDQPWRGCIRIHNPCNWHMLFSEYE